MRTPSKRGLGDRERIGGMRGGANSYRENSGLTAKRKVKARPKAKREDGTAKASREEVSVTPNKE